MPNYQDFFADPGTVGGADLVPRIYDELRALAAAHFASQPGNHTLQPTALVHDVYLRMASSPNLQIADRVHFLRVASKLMRNLLVDHARSRGAQKRGGDWNRVTLAGVDSATPEFAVDSLDLEAAMEKLSSLDRRRANLVELRFYGGLTLEEAAESLGISPETGKREWRLARAWISRELNLEPPP